MASIHQNRKQRETQKKTTGARWALSALTSSGPGLLCPHRRGRKRPSGASYLHAARSLFDVEGDAARVNLLIVLCDYSSALLPRLSGHMRGRGPALNATKQSDSRK